MLGLFLGTRHFKTDLINKGNLQIVAGNWKSESEEGNKYFIKATNQNGTLIGGCLQREGEENSTAFLWSQYTNMLKLKGVFSQYTTVNFITVNDIAASGLTYIVGKAELKSEGSQFIYGAYIPSSEALEREELNFTNTKVKNLNK